VVPNRGLIDLNLTMYKIRSSFAHEFVILAMAMTTGMTTIGQRKKKKKKKKAKEKVDRIG